MEIVHTLVFILCGILVLLTVGFNGLFIATTLYKKRIKDISNAKTLLLFLSISEILVSLWAFTFILYKLYDESIEKYFCAITLAVQITFTFALVNTVLDQAAHCYLNLVYPQVITKNVIYGTCASEVVLTLALVCWFMLTQEKKYAPLLMVIVRLSEMVIITTLSVYIIHAIRKRRKMAGVGNDDTMPKYLKVIAVINALFFITTVINVLIIVFNKGVIFDRANITSATLVLTCYFLTTMIYCFAKKSERKKIKEIIFKAFKVSTSDNSNQHVSVSCTDLSNRNRVAPHLREACISSGCVASSVAIINKPNANIFTPRINCFTIKNSSRVTRRITNTQPDHSRVSQLDACDAHLDLNRVNQFNACVTHLDPDRATQVDAYVTQPNRYRVTQVDTQPDPDRVTHLDACVTQSDSSRVYQLDAYVIQPNRYRVIQVDTQSNRYRVTQLDTHLDLNRVTQFDTCDTHLDLNRVTQFDPCVTQSDPNRVYHFDTCVTKEDAIKPAVEPVMKSVIQLVSP